MESDTFYFSRVRFPFLKIFFLVLVPTVSYLTGIFLPYPPVASADDYVPSVQSIRRGTITKISQIKKEEILYRKAPKEVLAAATVTKTQQGPWGVARQIGEHTWTITVGSDASVGTPQEILQALNSYRNQHGSASLSWDGGLGSFAQGRSDSFQATGNTDAHAGFTDFINNKDGFKRLGFMALGENSSIGYHVEAVHLIEWVYAGDTPHDQNQLNPQWTHVGIGVSGLATDLVFGGKKM